MKKIEEGVKTLDEKMNEYCAEDKFSGLLRVTFKDNIIYQKCAGIENIETNTPISEKSRFTFYSLSKPFCALGLMKLTDKGLVSLSDHPGKYVPEAVGFDKRVTIYQMLHHISGMTDFADCDNYELLFKSDKIIDMRNAVFELSKHKMRFEPGTETQYANINFSLVSLIIENVTGMSYEDYMQAEIFNPLGMKTAVTDRPGLMLENRAVGFDKEGDTVYAVNCNVGWMKGAGDINGTADDVYCLNKAIKHKLLVFQNSWKEILTPSDINLFGCGCTVSVWHGKKRITHNGGHIGFRTLHIQLPKEDFDIILLSNYGFGNAREEISEMVYEAFFGKDRKASNVIVMDGKYIHRDS